MFSFKSALAGAALSLALVGGISAARAQTSPHPMNTAHPMTSAHPMTTMPGMSGGMMQMMNDPVAMCDQMMHAIATDPVMHKKMNALMLQAMHRSQQQHP